MLYSQLIVLLHPDNYTVEIYMNSLIDLISTNTIINGEIQGEFKWKEKNLEKKIIKSFFI